MTNPPTLSPISARMGNFSIAVRRFGRTWAKGVPSAAARRFLLLWPIWTGGLALAVLCAIFLDSASVVWVRGLPGPIVGFFQWLTDFGKSGWLLIPSCMFCLVLLLADWRSVNRRVAAAWTEIGLIVGFAFLSLAGSGIVLNIFKQLVGRGRPIVFERDGAFSLAPFQFEYAQASFPSGHSTTMGALAVVIAIIFPRIRVPAFAFCGLVAISRVFVSAHYPSDVVAGFLLGGTFTWFYALALTYGGIGFALEPPGTIRARAIAIRHVFARPGGLSVAMGGFWFAVVGRCSRKAS